VAFSANDQATVRQGERHVSRVGLLTSIAPKGQPSYRHDFADRCAVGRGCRRVCSRTGLCVSPHRAQRLHAAPGAL